MSAPSLPAVVHAIVVNWNGGEELVPCFRALAASVGPTLVLRCVDNGSEDGSLTALEAALPAVKIQRLGHNTGFAGGVNAGILAALEEGASHVWLVNTDALVAPEALQELCSAAQRWPHAGLFGPRIFADAERSRLWCCGVVVGGWPNLCRLRGHGRAARPGLYAREERVASLTGCGLLISAEVFEAIGSFDEGYFVYGEDLDFCDRAQAAGFASVYVPSAELVHRGGGSTGGGYGAARKYLSGYAAARFLRRRGTAALWVGWLALDVLAWPLSWLLALRRGAGAAARAKARGMWDGIRGRRVDRGVVERARASA